MTGPAPSQAAPGPVRRASHRDLDRLVELWIEQVAHHARLDDSFALRPEASGEIRRLLLAQLGDASTAIWVWDEDGQLSGMSVVRFERAPAILRERSRAEITDLGVRVDRRRRGIGRALARAALAWVVERGAPRVEVRVAARNVEGQAFWRALDFGDFMDVLQRRL